MATYNELVTTVRDWANRDSSVLPDAVIQKALRYSADEAYRLLEIPALEYTRYYIADTNLGSKKYVYRNPDGTYTQVTPYDIDIAVIDDNSVNANVNTVSVEVPGDTVSFIFLRKTGSYTNPEVGTLVDTTTITESNYQEYIVVNSTGVPVVTSPPAYSNTMFNEKTDIRSFYDFSDTEYYENYFARKGSQLVLAGNLKDKDVYELFYYRRLPALDARENLPQGLSLIVAEADINSYEVITATEYDALPPLQQRLFDNIEGSYVRSKSTIYNWLRDENERVILFGSLHRVFDYLQEDVQSEKYKARFLTSIKELNDEEKKRKMSAGQVITRFNANGLI